jgi:hypothetical protein
VIAALLVTVLCAPSAAQTASPRPLGQARDAAGQGLAFIELSVAKDACFLQESVHVRVRFGVEREFLAERMVQPFGAKLEVPVQISMPWIDGLPGALVTPVEPDAASIRFAQNESVHRALVEPDRVVEGRRFLVCSEEVVLLPMAIGPLRIPGPVLSFAYATKFEDKFLAGRVPVDRVDASIAGEGLTLEVRPLPEVGRPKEFTGAVGGFSIRAETEPSIVTLGGSLKLRLIIEGEGNRSLFDPPRWTELGGFRVLGMLDEKGAAARTLTYDLAPLSAQAWQVPAISFAYFDPSPPEGYRVVRTQPIDVVVRPGEKAAVVAREPRPSTTEGAEVPATHGTRWFLPALAALLVVMLLLEARRRRG